ncbi:hypothetical protein AC623_20355 [Bacillus sp. FJAT-27231]|uniref:DUF5592 family protein n=1 Tax=Bacillus sp. FJAT-27231 TaxID=1679168 RepID=UPI0006714340|nr:DUF5592 family protein [Bacillus sp. FJAT-27231]KMY52558.1 hypothetical protein AC623_20355 [Bacillus sp. FJAT-27231]
MANYRIPKEISSELKINKVLFLFDLLFIIGLIVLTLIFNNFVHNDLRIAYYLFMAIVGIIMIWRPSTNPKKRMYEVLLITIMRKRNTYCAIDREQE